MHVKSIWSFKIRIYKFKYLVSKITTKKEYNIYVKKHVENEKKESHFL